MTRCLQFQLAATVFLLAGGVPSGYTSGQQADDRGVPALVTRVYAVVDLALSTPDYEYEGQIPSTAGGVRSPRFRGGGGFGGGGDTGGGGIFSVPSDQSGTRQRSDFHHLAQIGGGGISGGGMGGGGIGGGFLPAHPVSMVLDFDSLIEVITSVIEPDSWDENGGPGSLSAMGALLCVRQTEPVHTQIQQLLDDIRREGGRLRSVTVEARWLLLDSAGFGHTRRSIRSCEQSAQVCRTRETHPRGDQLPRTNHLLQRAAGLYRCRPAAERLLERNPRRRFGDWLSTGRPSSERRGPVAGPTDVASPR